MADSLWDLSLRDALLATASSRPTPGGGSIAAVTGALGLGLVLMALEVSQKKRKTEALASAIARGKVLLGTIGQHADRDVAVFEIYMRALGLPKQTAEDQVTRSAALRDAVLGAATVPLSAADACLEGLRYAESVAGLIQSNIVSDLTAGADLLFGSLKAVLRSVSINLPAMRDQASRQRIADRAHEIALLAEQTYARIQSLAS